MKSSLEETVQTLQKQTQRLLGRCLLQLQQYERQIKLIVAHHEISGSAQTLQTTQASRENNVATKTLGALVNNLLTSYIRPDHLDEDSEKPFFTPEGTNAFGMRLQLNLSESDFAQVEKDLKELVHLRNNLVHHFIDQHDLWSIDGCRDANDALVAAGNLIDQRTEQLRDWAKVLDQTRRQALEFLQSGAGYELIVNGIAPDGTVHWPAAGIVYALRRAVQTLAVDGWVSVDEASKWIAKQEPKRLPAKYQCNSWRQVIHDSRLFELRYFVVDGQPSAWYREKIDSSEEC